MIARTISLRRLRPCVSLFRRFNHHGLKQISTRKFSSDIQDHEEVDFVFKSDFSVKDLLYADSKDDIIQKIKQSESFEELKPFIEKIDSLEKDHLCQLILVLSEQLKTVSPSLEHELDSVISRVHELVNQMTIEEISYCFNYLAKLGFSIKHPTMELLTNKVLDELQKLEDFPLSYLTHFTYGLNSDKGLYSSIIAVSTIPQISRQLEKCSNTEDLHLITICLGSISHLLSIDLLEEFKRKVEELLNLDLLNEEHPKVILKIINFLNYPHWSFRNTSLQRRLQLELEENIQFFDTRSLITIHRSYGSQKESAKIVPLLVKRAQALLEVTPSVELLTLAVLNVTPDQRQKIAEMLRKFLSSYQISSTQTSGTLQTVFKILRLLKISDIDLCDTYWTKVLNEVFTVKEPDLNFQLARCIHKYMFFNNNLGGTYRHIEFEKTLIEMLLLQLKTTIGPRYFAMFSSFIIAYGDGTSDRKIPQDIVDKIEELNEQFTIRDCVQISRGVQIGYEVRFFDNKTPQLEDQLDSINCSLGKCANRHSQQENLHISEINSIIRTYSNRKALKDNFLFHSLINYFNTDRKLELNSRLIHDITQNLTKCNYRMDPICSQFVDYTLDNWEHITGNTVEKILTCSFNFSYFPEKLQFFDRCSEIIVRDFNYMNGLSIVQALHALIFYKSCPQQLIAMVFSSEFVKRLEQEVAMCFSKNTYPQRVMNAFTQLNRAVCLDCPEVNVKWFQQSFIEAQASKDPVIHSRLQKDLNSVLLSIVNVPGYLKVNRVTAYGYRVDFEVNIDQYNRFIEPKPDDYHQVNYMPNVNKIAILMLNNKMLCDNDLNRLKGSELLRMRHLEMLGYRVVHVKTKDFTCLYRNVSAKIKFLKNLLQIAA